MRILSSKNLYLEQSGYLPALSLEKSFGRTKAGLACALTGVFGALFIFLTFLFVDEKSLAWVFLGVTEILLGAFFIGLVYWLLLSFLERDAVLTPDEVEGAWQRQMYGRGLTWSTAQIIDKAATEQDLLLGDFFKALSPAPQFLWVLRRLNIPPQDFQTKIQELYPPGAVLPLSDVLKTAWQKAIAGNHSHVLYTDLLVAVYELDQNFQNFLFAYQVKEQEIREAAYWQRREEERLRLAGRFWQRRNLLNTSGIGKGWQSGWTLNLDRVANDLTRSVQIHKPPAHLYGHRLKLELLEQMLVRGGANNVVLVGDPGVGKHTLLRAFAAKVNWGETYGPLRYQRLLAIDSSVVLSGASSLNAVLERIEVLFTEALLAENVILVINDFDAFFDPRPEAGRVNATEALLPFLQSRLRIIGLMTPMAYLATIEKNPHLARLISKLEVAEPSERETLLILQDEAPRMEKQSGLFFTHLALREIVKLATRLIQNLPNPEKSLEVMEETTVYVATKTNDVLVLPEHVERVVSLRTKVPVEKVAGEEKETLLNLESILHQRIVGQEEAIRELADALRRARSGIRSEKKPIGSFLFLGPTGVGKTETAKALAAVYFGSEQRIIRFDMSEFQEVHALNRLIGDPDTHTGGLLTEAVINNPFSLILFDELEKAHPKLLDLFLQVFDEGRLTDALGRTVSFVNTMIIATSNAGTEQIRELVKAGRNLATAREELLESLQRQGIFRPEFLNRFDAVVIFHPLTSEELQMVAVLLLRELNTRLAEKDIQVKISPELASFLAAGGYSPELGARPLRRFIQEKVENYIAKGLISGEIDRGQVIEIPPQLLETAS